MMTKSRTFAPDNEQNDSTNTEYTFNSLKTDRYYEKD